LKQSNRHQEGEKREQAYQNLYIIV